MRDGSEQGRVADAARDVENRPLRGGATDYAGLDWAGESFTEALATRRSAATATLWSTVCCAPAAIRGGS